MKKRSLKGKAQNDKEKEDNFEKTMKKKIQML